MIITLCGSARFEKEWYEFNKKLGLIGHICFSLVTFPSVEGGNKSWYTDDEKETLDLGHLAKIEESDAILVLNIGGYIGDSTRREMKWAEMRNKIVFVVEPQHFKHLKPGPQDIPGWADL